MDLPDGQATSSRDIRSLQPKHKVFLGHSGSQKAFVEQLDVDLRRWDRYPFFDKDRDSLPIGEPFPGHIFEAIQHCEVGVVVLSKEFLSSKWPMVELVEMVRTIERRPGQMRLIPIFLSISCADLGDEKKLCAWKARWATFDKRTSICEFENALKVVKATNGLVFNPGVDEVKFREEIVKSICNIVPPFHRWNDSHVQGRSRLSKAILEKIEKIPISQRYGAQVVGLYGVGGIGKTTCCKSLYIDLSMKFEGRVCHLEFGNDSSEKERLQEVLKRLIDSNNEVIKDLKVDELWSRLNDLMKMKKVFLAIDNVSDNMSIDEAKRYLQAGYCSGSIVLVTARSLDDLRYLRIDGSYCLEMPELEEDEARSLFLDHADPQIEVNDEVLKQCVNRCYFSKGNGSNSHYHPLALKVLGSQLASKDPNEWVEQLKEGDVFNQRRERQNPVFSILRRSYDELRDDDKMMFIDVVLFDTQDDYKTWRCRYEFPIYKRSWFLVEWLSMVHGKTEPDVEKQLNGLKKKGLLEDLGDGEVQIGMHDLWREFAHMEMKEGTLRSRRWVHEILEGGVVGSVLSSGGWKNVQRICVMKRMDDEGGSSLESSVECLNFSDCSEATVLKLVSVDVEMKVLDLSALKQLKSLEIINDWDGESLRISPVVSGIRMLSYLKVLIWLGINVNSMSVVEEISSLRLLQVLQLACFDFEISTSLDLSELRCLREMRIELWGELMISGLSTGMKNFQILDLSGCRRLRRCPGVGDLIPLKLLMLRECKHLDELPNLKKLTNLHTLDLSYCSLKRVPGLGNLVALERLYADGCDNLDEVPDLSNLTKLQVFEVMDSKSLKRIPGFGNLIALERFNGGGPFLQDMPQTGYLRKLQRVTFYGWYEQQDSLVSASAKSDEFNLPEPSSINLAILESVSTLWVGCTKYEFTNLSKLKNLQNLCISECGLKTLPGLEYATALKSFYLENVGLERLPHMGKDMRLERLEISKCIRLIGWDGVDLSECERGLVLQCSWILPYLEVLHFSGSGLIVLPDLSHFPQLRELTVSKPHLLDNLSRSTFSLHCVSNRSQLESLDLSYLPIKELPNLKSFPFLRDLSLNCCENLTSVSSSGVLTALKSLRVRGCKNLEALPDVDLLPSLRAVDIVWSEVKLNAQLVKNLRARGRRPCLHEGSSSKWYYTFLGH